MYQSRILVSIVDANHEDRLIHQTVERSLFSGSEAAKGGVASSVGCLAMRSSLPLWALPCEVTFASAVVARHWGPIGTKRITLAALSFSRGSFAGTFSFTFEEGGRFIITQ